MENSDHILKKHLSEIDGDPIVGMVFGSHLYGLSTPDSDYDYRGVFIPNRREWILGKAPVNIKFSTGDDKSRNSSDDIDLDIVSIVKFIEDAVVGEVFAIDMLHCDNPISTSPLWDYIKDNRTKFYSKGMKSYMGYLKRQVHKYGVKGSRMSDLEKVYTALGVVPGDEKNSKITGRVEMILDLLPFDDLEHIQHDRTNGSVVVLGKKFYYRAHIYEMLHSMDRAYLNYGARAREARDNKGVDWKAVSHALRAGYQQRAIFLNGDFSYPLAETDYLLKVKTGKLDFVNEVQPELDSLVEEVTALAESSDLPDTVDVDFWDDFIVQCFEMR